jgi:prepilin-type processing-associated H-X9-DG protein
LDRPDIDNSIRSFPAARPTEGSAQDTLVSHPLNVDYVNSYNATSGSNAPLPSFLEILLCPSDAARGRGGQASHYVVNAGRADDLTASVSDYPSNGVFQGSEVWHNGLFTGAAIVPANYPTARLANNRIGAGFISRGDGLSTTLMLSENVDAGNWTDLREDQNSFVWWPYVDPLPTIVDGSSTVEFSMARINGQLGQAKDTNEHPSKYARPSAYHPGGVNVAFAGGNVRFISEEMTYHVYILLMTPNGRGAVDTSHPVTGSTPTTPYGSQHSLLLSSGGQSGLLPGSPLDEASIIP